jgi:hypothetical protein
MLKPRKERRNCILPVEQWEFIVSLRKFFKTKGYSDTLSAVLEKVELEGNYVRTIQKEKVSVYGKRKTIDRKPPKKGDVKNRRHGLDRSGPADGEQGNHKRHRAEGKRGVQAEAAGGQG